MLDLTIVILAKTDSDLSPVLVALARQTGLERFTWEVLLVLEAKTKAAADAARSTEIARPDDWPKDVQLSPLVGFEQGAAETRQEAIETVRGRLVGFLYPDMIVAPDWIRSALDFAEANSSVGAIGSRIEPRWEREPDFDILKLEWLMPHIGVVRLGLEPKRYFPWSRRSPLLGGTVVRRNIWLSFVPKQLFLLSASCGLGVQYADREAVFRILRSGWQIWHNPEMRIERDVPLYKVQPAYLYGAADALGRSRNNIRMLCHKPRQRPFMLVFYIVRDVLYLLWHCLRYPSPQHNIEAMCERKRALGSIKSLRYLWTYVRRRWQQGRSS
ncbi:MAG: glycosyltransferase [Geitlerinemataceae cyanobacterium]